MKEHVEPEFFNEQFVIIKKVRNVKDATIRAYLISIKKLLRECFNGFPFSLSIFKSTLQIKEYLQTIKSIATKKNIVTSIIVILKANLPNETKPLDFYTELLTELANSQKNGYIDNEKSKRETENWVSQEEIRETISIIKKRLLKENATTKPLAFTGTDTEYLDLYQMYLLLCLYTMVPPLRNDWAMTHVLSKTQPEEFKENYINLETKELVLQNYKTAKIYGKKIIPLPEELIDIVTSFETFKRSTFDVKHTILLVLVTTLNPMSKSKLTWYLNRIFYPKKTSTTLLRKSYLSEKYPVIHSQREKEKDAYAMGHSVGIASTIYSKK